MKKILIHILNFILSLSIFFLIILSIFQANFLNVDRVKMILTQNNYYEEIYLDIKDSFENNLMESGLDIDEITDSILKDEVKKDIDSTIDSLLNNQELKLHDTDLREKIDDKINLALTNSNRTPSQEEKKDIERLENKLVEIYKDEITIMPSLITKTSSTISKLRSIITIAKTITLIIVVTLIILNVKLNKNYFNDLGICLLTSGIISISVRLILGNKYQSILIMSQTFSKLLISFIETFISNITVVGIIMLLLGIIFILINILKSTKRKLN